MDAARAPPGKPSALPRPGQLSSNSKLPTFLPRSRLPNPPQPAPSQPQPQAQPADPAPLPKTAAIPQSRLTKKPSTSTLPRTSQIAPRSSISSLRPPSKPVAARTGLTTGTKNVAKPPASVAARTKPQKRQTSGSLSTNDDEENNDQLASLDSFRSASRQGSRLGFRDDSPPETLDFVDGANLASNIRPRKPSRPSLSDRTIDSLQALPSTPKERRRSSFFNPVESPMGPPPRPGSSLSRNGSAGNNSRPGTSDGAFARPQSRPASPAKRVSASAQPPARTNSRLPSLGSTPLSKRSVSGGFTSKLQKAQMPSTQRTASPAKQLATPNGLASRIGAGNKTVASSRPAKPRPALGEAFNSPKKPATENGAPAEPKRVVSNSSAALRQQIAAAKAAARKEKMVQHDSPQDLVGPVDMGKFDEEIHNDPFNQAPKDEKHILRNRIKTARVDGKLNIAAMSLKELPEEVRNMYSSAAMEESNVNWAEVVDLTKLIAADNEFEQFDDGVFPDLSPGELDADDQTEGNQFGGLEVLDIHGNSLQTLPIGLRRLERLTRLDVTHNKLDSAAFDIVAQIKSLREVKLGHNNLTGNLPTSICELPNLEILDLQANRLLSLPEALRELVSLRVLNVAGNQLTALPMEALQQLPLIELNASSNALIASLFPLGGPTGLPSLQVLNVANNSLAALTFTEPLDLPRLKSLDITNNHMTVLPAVSDWNELLTLLAGDNKLTELPQGFTTLQKLRNANFTSNELRTIDPEVSRMSSLETLILASNPLRERKFLTMTAADIKRDLKARLAPRSEDGTDDLEEPASPVTVVGDYERPASAWSTKANAVLELGSKNLSDDVDGQLGSFLSTNEVRSLELQNNSLTCIPPTLRIGQNIRVLNLAENSFSADYLYDEMELSSLRDLNVSKCRLTSLDPLISHLIAPNLQSLNINANRITGPLPPLKHIFQSLTTLHASDNRFISISVEALRGMITVNLDSNDIEHLPPEIGRLWDEGLKTFSVARNAFRVPNYRVLEKGTEATLRWLRGRLPAGDLEESMD